VGQVYFRNFCSSRKSKTIFLELCIQHFLVLYIFHYSKSLKKIIGTVGEFWWVFFQDFSLLRLDYSKSTGNCPLASLENATKRVGLLIFKSLS
jgi:hypothetical protein